MSGPVGFALTNSTWIFRPTRRSPRPYDSPAFTISSICERSHGSSSRTLMKPPPAISSDAIGALFSTLSMIAPASSRGALRNGFARRIAMPVA